MVLLGEDEYWQNQLGCGFLQEQAVFLFGSGLGVYE